MGDDGFLMSKVHVNHDGRIGDEVTLSGDGRDRRHTSRSATGRNLGLGTVVHQRLTVGEGSMIGMQSAVTRQLPPYVVSMGVPARPARLNTYRLARLGVPAEQHEAARGRPAARLARHRGPARHPAGARRGVAGPRPPPTEHRTPEPDRPQHSTERHHMSDDRSRSSRPPSRSSATTSAPPWTA